MEPRPMSDEVLGRKVLNNTLDDLVRGTGRRKRSMDNGFPQVRKPPQRGPKNTGEIWPAEPDTGEPPPKSLEYF